MLHTLKKKVNYHSKAVETSAEFQLYKGLLERVKENMSTASKYLDDCNALWLEQFKLQRDFSGKFLSGYIPVAPEDKVEAAAREFSDAASARHARYVKETGLETASYHRIHASINEYIRQIEALEASYSSLASAKSEADRYQSKVDSMEKSKRQIDEKKARNIEKHDTCREKYEIASRRMLESQKALYAKATLGACDALLESPVLVLFARRLQIALCLYIIVFPSSKVSQMALVAFWRAQNHQMDVMHSTIKPAFEYALEHERDMAVVNIAAVDDELEVVQLTSTLPTPSTIPPSPPPHEEIQDASSGRRTWSLRKAAKE